MLARNNSQGYVSIRISRERLRWRYRPEVVKLLFIGEAPPASGRFFYRGDSGLFRAMREAFGAVLPAMGDAEFLAAFAAAGCYLIDACPYPVDRLEPRARRSALAASEPLLSRRIKDLQPQSIATLVRSIRDNVERAASRAHWEGTLLDLPYPGRWVRHREAFVKLLAPEIAALI
jgi:hypothetical protein